MAADADADGIRLPTAGADAVDQNGQTLTKTSKRVLRRRMLARRASLAPPDRSRASARIDETLARLPELSGARTILGYAAFGTEVNLDTYLAARIGEGRGVFLPWVEHDRLRIARVTDLDTELATGFAGLREPRPDVRRAARPDRLDAVVLPGLAFDRRGARLGYGGGYFDRLLAEVGDSTIVVGVAYDAQFVDELPSEPHDRPMDVVVTNARVVRP